MQWDYEPTPIVSKGAALLTPPDCREYICARRENVDLEPNYSAMVVIYIQNTIEKSNGKLWLHGGDVGAAPFVVDVYTRLLREARY